jgi:hypothetical protein
VYTYLENPSAVLQARAMRASAELEAKASAAANK